jgi:uncharacterized membrane protein
MTARPAAFEITALATKTQRIQSIDVVRGIVMIIMALDHVRDYFHRDAFLYSPTDLTQTSVLLFFTRFVTHFCAPVFVLLAGTSAYLYGLRNGDRALSWFLFTRGLWLVLIEIAVISPLRTFNPLLPLLNLQVIWAIGVSMIALAAFVRLPRWSILMLAIVLIAGHNALDAITVAGDGVVPFLWSLAHVPGHFTFGFLSINVIYPLAPWIGIIALGYCLGELYAPDYDASTRRYLLLVTGLCALGSFALLRGLNLYGDAAPWSVQAEPLFSALSVLNVTKYPPSLLYILLTLGPACVLLACIEKVRNGWTSTLAMVGRVPMFYYIAHILLIHLLAIPAVMIAGHPWTDMILDGRVNASAALHGYGFNLFVVYGVWMALVAMLYAPCRWFDRYKREHQARQWWLSYL